jgi:hypothetical protein
MLGALPRQASGDPAMVSGFRMASILSRKLFPAFLGSTLKDMTASALCPSRIAGFDGPAKPAHESMMQKRAPTARA